MSKNKLWLAPHAICTGSEPTMLLLPLYIVLINLGLINSYIGIVVIYSATALPFCRVESPCPGDFSPTTENPTTTTSRHHHVSLPPTTSPPAPSSPGQ